MNDLEKAHKHSTNNKNEVLKSEICGCFYCCKIFTPKSITSWVKGNTDMTAQCPYCLIDSVIGSASGFAITKKFLKEMNIKWFN